MAWVVLLAVLAPVGANLPEAVNDEYVLPGGSQTARLGEELRARFRAATSASCCSSTGARAA